MKVLIKQLGGIQKTVEDAEDALAGIYAMSDITDCLFAYTDRSAKRTVSFHIPHPYPSGIPTVEDVEAGSKVGLYRGQEYVLVEDTPLPTCNDEDKIHVKII